MKLSRAAATQKAMANRVVHSYAHEDFIKDIAIRNKEIKLHHAITLVNWAKKLWGNIYYLHLERNVLSKIEDREFIELVRGLR